MPWKEMSIMERREEFFSFASQEGANISLLCRQFGISRQTGYKWLGRGGTRGEQSAAAVFSDQSRRPACSPKRTCDTLEQAILRVRDAHPAWGARKIGAVLQRDGFTPPATSTVHAVLARHNRIAPGSHAGKAFGRFEKEEPNLLWQMDFKGQFQLGNGVWCFPLTVVDDHSRFSLCIGACDNQRTQTVKSLLEETFKAYGLPAAFYLDNGSPWGNPSGEWSALTVWMLKLGIEAIFSRPYCPQGRGKNERFHRTFKAEVLAATPFTDIISAQKDFDRWRAIYNQERPHEGIEMKVPVSRYCPSLRSMPDTLPTVEYDSCDIVRKVSPSTPFIYFKGKEWRVPNAFKGEQLAVRPKAENKYDICFGATPIAEIDLSLT